MVAAIVVVILMVALIVADVLLVLDQAPGNTWSEMLRHTTTNSTFGIEAWAYCNNPWEIWAYAVEGGRAMRGDDSLIWVPYRVSWIVATAFYALVVGFFMWRLVVRHMS